MGVTFAKATLNCCLLIMSLLLLSMPRLRGLAVIIWHRILATIAHRHVQAAELRRQWRATRGAVDIMTPEAQVPLAHSHSF